MLQKFFNSFNPDKNNDPFFGEIELHFNEPDNSYYLMKDMWLDENATQLSLTVESKTRQATQQQFTLYNQISSDFARLLDMAYAFIAAREKVENTADLKKKYQPASVYIGDLGGFHANWELSFLDTEDGLTYCIVEFDGTTPTSLSFEE